MASIDHIRGRLEVLNELWDYLNSPAATCAYTNLANKYRTELSWLVAQIATKRREAEDTLKEAS